MGNLKLKHLLPICIFFMVLCAFNSTVNCKADTANNLPEISYKAHVQNIGWQNPVNSNNTTDAFAGTIGQSLRVEAIKMNLVNAPGNSDIIYEAHVQNIGWQRFVKGSDPTAFAGTQGQSLRVEAIRIRLQGDITNNYSVQYKAHVQNIGWMDWVHDGQIAGTQGKSFRIEAIKIRLVPKVHPESISIKPETDTLKIGKSHTLSADILPNDTTNKNVNWTSSKPEIVSVDNAGTITAKASGKATITASCQDGGKSSSCTVTVPEAEPSIEYTAHVQNIGWQNPVSSTDDTFAGTQGQALRVEAIKIRLLNIPGASLSYQAHVQNIGWQNPVSTTDSAAFAGTQGQGLRVEAIKIKLQGENTSDYSVQYKVHVQNIGWMDWVHDGQIAGTQGQALRIEAIKIRLVKKVNPSLITLNKSQDTLKVGQSDNLSATISPDNATNKAVTWSSADSTVASVDSTGKVTAIREGTVYITATSVDNKNVTSSCKVTVSNENDSNVVTFKDKYLENAVRSTINKPTGTLYMRDVINIQTLDASGNKLGGKITDLSGIEKLVSLKFLNLSSNSINDISALKSLKNLQSLSLDSNNFSTITSLSDLIELDTLSIINNQIKDLSPLYYLSKLTDIYIYQDNLLNQADVNSLQSHLPNCRIHSSLSK